MLRSTARRTLLYALLAVGLVVPILPARLEQVIRTAYSEVFEAVDPATASDGAIETAFRFYVPQPQRDKMVALFMGLCDAAGMLPADKAPPKRTMRVAGSTTPRRSAADGGGRERQTPPADPPPADPPTKDPPKPVTGKEALKARYIEVLIEKAATSDDDKLLDRIEALLREDESKD